MKQTNIHKNRSILSVTRNMFILVSLFLLAYLFISERYTAAALPTPPLTQEVLGEKALALAKLYGLQALPDRQKVVLMTQGEWYALNDAELGQDASEIGQTKETPVFVFAIRGNVEWKGFGLPNPNQAGPQHYDNMTVVLNALTGEPVWVGSKYTGFAMPVPVD